MGLTSEELQLIEQAVENEIHNISKVIERSLDHRKEEWIIKQRRLAIAMRELKACPCAPLQEYKGNWRYSDEV